LAARVLSALPTVQGQALSSGLLLTDDATFVERVVQDTLDRVHVQPGSAAEPGFGSEQQP
jgi:hypothetical protein